MNFMNIRLVGEPDDLPCNPTRYNTVIKTKHGSFKIADNTIWDSWVMGIVFPDNQKADYFVKNFNESMHDYREGMLKDEDYVVHVLHFKFPKPKELYADKITVSKT